MKRKLLCLFIFCISITGFAQTIAYPVPSITVCNLDTFDLTPMIPQVLGGQDPQMHTVTFYESQANAVAGLEPLVNVETYFITASSTQIFIRVENIFDNTYDITSFYIINNVLDFPAMYGDVYTCTAYTTPAIGPEFTIQYFFNYDIIPGATGATYTVTQSGILGITVTHIPTGCTASVEYNVTIEDVEANPPAPLTLCDPDIDGFGTFDLTTTTAEITNMNTGLEVTYYTSMSEAMVGDNPITMPTAYHAANGTIVYARASSTVNFLCHDIVSLTLTVQQCNNTISGKVIFDADANGCSENDNPASGISIYCVAGNTTYQTFTNQDGTYQLNNLPGGTNVVTIVQNSMGLTFTPTAHVVTLPADATDKDFCITSPAPVNDVSVYLVPLTTVRPGFPTGYALLYQNLGNQPASGLLSVYFQGALMSYVSSSPEMLQTGNMLTISFTNMQPFNTQVIYIDMLVNTPPAVELGTSITLAAALTPGTADTNSSNDTAVLQQVAVNSYDPNDIIVREGQFVTLNYAQTQPLTYTVRFQNIGTADAINVKIDNTLDNNLDWNSFTPVAASHNYRAVRNGNNVQFLFDDINLPGAEVNEPGSHGFVTYKIRPKQDIAIGDVMQNSASIYFDFNAPIQTNQVSTMVESTAGVNDTIVNNFTVYPNPAQGVINIKGTAAANLVINDILGKTVLTAKCNEAETPIDISSLKAGIYLITIVSEGKSATKKLVVR